jgi:hypothetical protein
MVEQQLLLEASILATFYRCHLWETNPLTQRQ